MVDSSELAPIVLFYGLLFFFVIRRSVRMAVGTPYQEGRLIGMAIVYLLIFGLTVAVDLLILPLWSFAADAAIIVVGALVATQHVGRTVSFHPAPQGGWNYRLGLLLPAIYLTLFAVRVFVEFVVLNQDPFNPPAVAPVLTTPELLELGTVTALFALSCGLLVGRSVGVIRAFGRLPKGPPAPSAPLR